MKYFVYILRCADDTFYTGITTDLKRRLKEHNKQNGSLTKYTRVRQPVKLVYSISFTGRSKASKEESRIKKFSRKQKESLILGGL